MNESQSMLLHFYWCPCSMSRNQSARVSRSRRTPCRARTFLPDTLLSRSIQGASLTEERPQTVDAAPGSRLRKGRWVQNRRDQLGPLHTFTKSRPRGVDSRPRKCRVAIV
jgi:hypothetical protein